MYLPKLVHGSWFIVHRKKTVNCELTTENNKRLGFSLISALLARLRRAELPDINFKSFRAFSLIELLIVISLFGLAASLITAAYLSFERTQKVKNAALTLKNDIRLAQNKAHTGDKGPDSRCGKSQTDPLSTSSQVTLIGWFMTFSDTDGLNNSYAIRASCIYNQTDDVTYTDKIVNLPEGIRITKLDLVPCCPSNIHVLYRPLESTTWFYNPDSPTPPFFDIDDAEYYVPIGTGSTLTIELTGSGGTYNVEILPTGEVNEKR